MIFKRNWGKKKEKQTACKPFINYFYKQNVFNRKFWCQKLGEKKKKKQKRIESFSFNQ